MENKVKFQQHFLGKVKTILSTTLLFPMAASAHMISITANQQFPQQIAATASASATFTVTNIASKATVTAINQSVFPSNSGITLSSSTCGNLLSPGQSCVVKLSLQAPATSTAQRVTTALKMWAKPTADGVQYPIQFTVTPAPNLPTISIEPIASNQLPALRDPVIAQDSGNWLLVSGSTGNFHDFNHDFIDSIYVYNPSTMQKYSVLISATDLDQNIKNQLSSSSPEFLQDGDTFYIIGGFFTADNNSWTTLNTITSINVPGMINAIINGQTNLAQYTYVRTDIPQFKVTGGQLGKIGNDFYLTFGQDCEGSSYCTPAPIYTNSIYKFSTDPTLATLTILDTVTHPDLDHSGWRRRDYTLAPFMSQNTETLFAMAGPFTPGNDALVWTNGITFNNNLIANDNFINQQANQYSSGHLSMYSASTGTSYVASFSGLSNLYWAPTGLLYSNGTPYGNILGLISSNGTGDVQEYANLQPLCSGQPLASCLYMGLAAEFIPNDNYYDSRTILQLDQLPANSKTLVGYIYAGLLSTNQTIFTLPPPPQPNPPGPSYPSNQVYAVYVVPAAPGAVNWKNITNLYPGN